MENSDTPSRRFYAAIFDLDGVLVDTARYHYLAWKRLADELGFSFSESDNERLKGVSRMRSLEILLEVGGIRADEHTKASMAARKNAWYVESLSRLDASAILPGALDYLAAVARVGIPIALASASRNAPFIIKQLGLAPFFRYIVDTARIANAKPAPDIFLDAAKGLGVQPEKAVVFEDAPAGIEAAHAAGMYAIGVGLPQALPDADLIVSDLTDAALLDRLWGNVDRGK